MLQFTILSQPNRGLYLPTRLQQASINPKALADFVANNADVLTTGMPVYKYKNLNVVKCAGVEMRGLKASLAPRRQLTQAAPKLEEYTFTPYMDEPTLQAMSTPTEKSLRAVVDIVIENTPTLRLKVAEVVTKAEDSLALAVHDIALSQPMYQDDVTLLTLKSEASHIPEVVQKSGIKIVTKDKVEKLVPEAGAHLIVVDDMALVETVEASLKENAFILLQTRPGTKVLVENQTLRLVALKLSKEKQFHLFRKVNIY
jgi:fatty acid synthase